MWKSTIFLVKCRFWTAANSKLGTRRHHEKGLLKNRFKETSRVIMDFRIFEELITIRSSVRKFINRLG